MLIKNINPIKIQNFTGLKQNKNISVPLLKNDTFEKTVSFGAEENQPAKNDEFPNEFNPRDSKKAMIEEIHDLQKEISREHDVEIFIKSFSSSRTSQFLMKYKNFKIEDYIYDRLEKLHFDTEYFNELFQNAGLKTFSQLRMFLKVFNQNPETKDVFKDQNAEAIEIYGNLKNKSDLANFPEFLLHSYYKIDEEYGFDFDTVNDNLEFLHKIGINNSDELDEKCAHLKPVFNNFERTEDKIDAVNYLRETYDSKLWYIDEIKQNHKSLASLNAENIYKNNLDVVDYFYFGNEEPGLGDFENICELAVKSPQLKMPAVTKLFPFETPRDKVNFYKFLNDCKVDVPLFNSLTAKSVVSDSDGHNILRNYKSLTSYISETQGVDKKSADDFYVKFKDVINAVYTDENPDSIKDLMKVIKTFGLKNADSFIQLYNKIFEAKNKNITSDDVKNFVSIAVFAEDKDFFKTAKAQNVSPAEYLIAQKKQTESIHTEIEKFVDSDTTGYFAGQSVEEIYNQYKGLISQAPENVAGILKSVVDFNVENSEEYEAKAKEIERFAEFFDDRESLIKFLRDNNIKLDSSKPETSYRDCCFDVLNTVKNAGGENVETRLDYFKNSGILRKSQKQLSGFLQIADKQGTKQDSLCAIADGKFKSIRYYTRFIKRFKGENGTEKDLIEFIQKIPENIEINNVAVKLSQLQTDLENLNIPVSINSDNLKFIDLTTIQEQGAISVSDINNLLTHYLSEPDAANLVGVFPKSLKCAKVPFSSYQIADEIVRTMSNENEAYHNITKFLNADKESLGLEEDASENLHVKVLQSKLPEEFVEFVNSDEWLKYSDDQTKIPNLTFHARLRAIDRFAMPQISDISELYTQETKDRLKSLFKTIYTETPNNIKFQPKVMRIDFPFEDGKMSAVFSDRGKLITVYKRDK